MQFFSVKDIKSDGDEQSKQIFWFLFYSRKGSQKRIKIILQLKKGTRNTNQIAKKLKMDYNGVKHHMKILLKYNIVERQNNAYNIPYSLTPFFQKNETIFNEIKQKALKD